MKKRLIMMTFILLSLFVQGANISLQSDAQRGEVSNVIFQKDSKYMIYSRPLYQTVINFGDEVVEYAEFGDNVRWNVIEDTNSIRIKASDENLKTDLVVKTNQGTYYFLVSSYYQYYNPIINFLYPQKEEAKRRKRQVQEEPLNVIDLKQLNNSYTLSRKYNWTPTQIFDDGVKTYLIMNPKIQEMPVFLTRTEDGEYALVNFRIKETEYDTKIVVIDRIFKEGVLKLGKKQVLIKNKNYRF